MDWLLQYADPSIDWGYAMITLIVRFIGVFVVMGVMQVALQLSSRVVGMVDARADAAALQAKGAPSADSLTAPVPAGAPVSEAEVPLDDAVFAAIGVALALESRSAHESGPGATSNWGIAGRMQQLNRLPR